MVPFEESRNFLRSHRVHATPTRSYYTANAAFCLVAGVPYDSLVDITNVGSRSIIENDWMELQILADALEVGKSMDEATLLVNEHWQEDGSEPVRRSAAVYIHSLSLYPDVFKIGIQSQGNQDGSSNYGKACYNHVQQHNILVQFGHKPAHEEDLPNPLPD
jgi:hypothetical protein